MRAYSMDLRERVVAAVDAGMRPAQAAARFDVSVRSVERYLARRRTTGSLAPSVQRHGPKPEKKARVQAWLAARLDAAADATLAEHATAFAERPGVVVSTATMSRSLSTLPVDDPAQAVTGVGAGAAGRAGRAGENPSAPQRGGTARAAWRPRMGSVRPAPPGVL